MVDLASSTSLRGAELAGLADPDAEDAAEVEDV
jgi:hypothetical protein